MNEDKLYVVALPIGNRAELSFLARQILLETELIICEDTRNIRKFFHLNNWPDTKPTFISYHKFNESSRLDAICHQLKQKHTGVLVSDAGYPGICDPGGRLIQTCRQNKITIQVINGPCALIHCLVASGWSDHPWIFGGFSSHATNQIQKQLEQYQNFRGIIAFYVSMYAVDHFITAVIDVFGDECELCIGRELTKKYEEVRIDQVVNFRNQLKLKGEFVFLIKNLEPKPKKLHKQKLEMANALISLGVEKHKVCKFLGKYCFDQTARKLEEELFPDEHQLQKDFADH